MAGNCSLIEPTLVEFMDEISGNTRLLVTIIVMSVITVLLLFLFTESIVFIATKIPHRDRSISLIWMMGIFPIFALTSQIGLFIPRAVVMCNLTASIYFAISIYHFLQLVIYYYGGHDATERKIGEHQIFRQMHLAENSFWVLEICIYQMAIVRPIILFIEDILWLNGTYNTSSLTPDDAYLYLNIFTLLSSLVASIALLILLLASYRHLRAFHIGIKFGIIGLALFFSNIQILILDVLVFTDVIQCVKPFDWESRANSWQCVLLVFESLVLFPVSFLFFRTRRGNIVGVLEIPKISVKSPVDGNKNAQVSASSPLLKDPNLLRVRAESGTGIPRTRSSSSLYNSYTTV
ncbi:organic solute transporter subunit alpha-like [Diadema antillarum]|uniref:organic solute transporter subunit alpha-like n=1 Tax=Diadema antillarum TaxID=105358 RepID=UPI003A874B01